MMNIEFIEVDCGCYMYENDEERWILEDPTCGYLPTKSRMWDAIIQNPEDANVLKFLGSFKKKKQAIEAMSEKIHSGQTYFSLIAVENEFYNTDYSKK